MEPSRDQELPHKISKGSYSHRINHFLLWHTHTRLLRWNSLASYLISRLLPLFCCKTLMNTHSVMKRSEAEEFREQRVKTTVLFQSFSNVLEAFKCKLQHIFNSLLSKERKKKNSSIWLTKMKCNEQKQSFPLSRFSLCPGENDISAFSK